MKKLFLLFACTLMSLSTFADRNDGTSMKDIVEKVKAMTEFIEEQDLEVVRIECDILRTTKTTTRYLSKGWTYKIIAFGDYRFKDIDVIVYKKRGSEWYQVAKDDDNESCAIVDVTPSEDGEYMVEVKAYSYIDGYEAGHYGLIICHE